MSTTSIAGAMVGPLVGARALQVHSDAIAQVHGRPLLEPVRLSGHEGVNSLFEYELLLQTTSAFVSGAQSSAELNLDSFIGREISCRISLDGAGQFVAGAVGVDLSHLGAGTREINALITDAAFIGPVGRQMQYRLTLRPWLHLATLSTDCKIFQNKTVVQILDELLTNRSNVGERREHVARVPVNFAVAPGESSGLYVHFLPGHRVEVWVSQFYPLSDGHYGSGIGVPKYSINGQPIGRSSGWGGGGATSCCVLVARYPTQALLIDVEWETYRSNVDEERHHRTTVPVHFAVSPAKSSGIYLHFLPGHRVEAWVSWPRPASTEYPGPPYPQGPAPKYVPLSDEQPEPRLVPP